METKKIKYGVIEIATNTIMVAENELERAIYCTNRLNEKAGYNRYATAEIEIVITQNITIIQ